MTDATNAKDEAGPAPTPSSPGASAALAAAVAASLMEGGSTIAAGIRGGVGTKDAITAGFESFGFVALPALAFGLAARALLRRPNVARFTSGLETLLGGGPSPAREATAKLLTWAAVAAPVALAATIARRLAVRSSPTIVGDVTIGVLTLGLPLALLLAAWFGPYLGGAVERAVKRRSEVEQYVVPVAWMLGATGLVAALARLLPPNFMLTPAAACFGATIPALPGAAEIGQKIVRGRRGPILAVVALATASIAWPGLARVTPDVRMIVLVRSPYAGAVVTAARAAFDADRDGWSPVLAGGDCDDHDPTVYPGAHDIAGNGIDENCTGADAKPYKVAAQPPFAMAPIGNIPKRANIVLIQLDALRPDHVGFAGYKRPTTPYLDRFRQNATWFSRTYTPAPSTRFAMAAIFTGQDVDHIPQQRGFGIDFEMLPSATTFAASLGDVGYERVGFTISYVQHHIKGVGLGFGAWDTPWPTNEWEKYEGDSATLTTDTAIKTLADFPEDGSKPYLLFLHYRCTHDPYASKSKWSFGSREMDLYDSAAAYCDDELGRLLRTVEGRKDTDRTAIFIFSDHGELFGEHGLEAHGNSLYEPDVRALLVARIPTLHTSRVDVPVSLFDIDPTVLALAGLPPEPDLAGWNLLPLAAGEDGSASETRPLFLYAESNSGAAKHEARGVLLGRYKFIRDLSTSAVELYDVFDDPDERRDLASALPLVRAELEERLDAWQSAPAPPIKGTKKMGTAPR